MKTVSDSTVLIGLAKIEKTDLFRNIFYEDMLQAGFGINHPHLLKVVAETATDVIDWTRNTLGVKYQDRMDMRI